MSAFWERAAALVYLMAPAYLANMAPPFARFWAGWNHPINERWLGSHKTVVGALAGICAAIIAAMLQSRIAWQGSIIDYDRWPVIGLLLGGGAIGGDLTKSFLKRRIGIPPGARWIPFDQLDFVIGALVFIAAPAGLSWSDVIMILAVSFGGDVLVNHLAFALHVRETGW